MYLENNCCYSVIDPNLVSGFVSAYREDASIMSPVESEMALDLN